MAWLQSCILPVGATAFPVAVRNRSPLEEVSNNYDRRDTQT
ncbi:hypothetical protein LBMAG40_06770 [Cyanobium sp.]|nr:hypothetical protein LBMAG40_06770 [Cyanobium sp.]